MSESYVYFVQMEYGPRLVKIGVSAQIKPRMANLQYEHNCSLTFLGAFPGDRSTEESVHDRFAAHRVSGEWFNPHPDILAFIEEQQEGGFDPDSHLGDKIVINIRIDPELVQEIRERAHALGLNLSAYVRQAVILRLAEDRKDEKK